MAVICICFKKNFVWHTQQQIPGSATAEMPSFSAGASTQKQQNYQRWRQQIREQRKSLPIASVEKRLVDEVRKNDTLIIVGETGSGKTTRW